VFKGSAARWAQWSLPNAAAGLLPQPLRSRPAGSRGRAALQRLCRAFARCFQRREISSLGVDEVVEGLIRGTWRLTAHEQISPCLQSVAPREAHLAAVPSSSFGFALLGREQRLEPGTPPSRSLWGCGHQRLPLRSPPRNCSSSPASPGGMHFNQP